MKKIAGIVCEYNPFHGGHEYHIKKTREALGEDTVIICVMSGDFVQRGSAAIYPKEQRAPEAIKGGADLVVELPVPWCIAPAEIFAQSAVYILSCLGCTHISFGSESGDLSAIKSAADALDAPGFAQKLKEYMAQNPEVNYPTAVSAITGLDALTRPNDMLAVQYTRFSRDLEQIAIKRQGSAHDGPGSASYIRDKIYSGELAADVEPVNRDVLETAIISRLRMLPRESFAALPFGENGIGARIYNAVRENSTLEDIYSSAKTKSCTMSHIRRLVLYAALGIKADDIKAMPPYGRVLAFNERGKEYISSRRGDETDLPVITLAKEGKSISSRCADTISLNSAAHDLYSMGFGDKNYKKCGNDYRITPAFVKII